MSISARALRFDDHTMWVELSDGRTLGVPFACFPRLRHATAEQRQNYEMSGGGEGLHWDELGEDISVPALLAGHADATVGRAAAAQMQAALLRGAPEEAEALDFIAQTADWGNGET